MPENHLEQTAKDTILICAKSWSDDPDSADLRALPEPELYDTVLPKLLDDLGLMLDQHMPEFLGEVNAHFSWLESAPWGIGPQSDKLMVEVFFLPVIGPAESIDALITDASALKTLGTTLRLKEPAYKEVVVTLMPGLVDARRLLTVSTRDLRKAVTLANLPQGMDPSDPLTQPTDAVVSEILTLLKATPTTGVSAGTYIERSLVGLWMRRVSPEDVSPPRLDEDEADRRFKVEARRVSPRLYYGNATEPYGAAREATLGLLAISIDAEAAIKGVVYDQRADRIDTYPHPDGLDIVVTYGDIKVGIFQIPTEMLLLVNGHLQSLLEHRSEIVDYNEDRYKERMQTIN